MVRSHSFAWILVSLLSLALAAPLQADITPSGDVDPTYHSWWTGGGDDSTNAYIGKTAAGSVTVNLDSDLISWKGYIGYDSGSTGEVTVDGSGSTWTIGGRRNHMYVGYYGQGTLNITNGGAVSNYRGYIGLYSGSTGVVTVDGSGSTWTNSGDLSVGSSGQGTLNIANGGAVNVSRATRVALKDGVGEIHFDGGTLTTRSLFAGPTHLTGTGTIDTHGLVSDVDLLFDFTHGLNQTLTFNSQPGQNITINLTQDSTGHLGAGYAGNGTLSIRDGVSVKSYHDGYIGYKAGATGVVTVDGSGSTWTNSSYLYVGIFGQGTLNITNGGAVSNTSGFIGLYSGSTGEVTVDGSGSTWTNSGDTGLYVGHYGQGTLNITNSGAVSNTYGYIGYGTTGVVTVDGSGSTWTNSSYLIVGCEGQGTLNITNGGAVSNFGGYLGHYSGSTGAVTVDGDGSVWTNSSGLYVGGNNSFSGGTGELTVSNGGIVEVGDVLKVWDGGTLNMGATGTVTVGGTMILVQDSTLTADAGATIHMTGSAFENESTNPDNLAGLGNLTLIFEGGSEGVDPFEVACEDMDAFMVGFDSNFALGTLQLGGADIGYVQLVDDYDNRPDWEGSEALYVENLILGAGSTLDLNGLNLYCRNFTDLGGSIDLNGGSITQVPEPATLAILVIGGMFCLGRRRRN